MKTVLIIALTLAVVFLAFSCKTPNKIVVPLNSKVEIEDAYTIIWNGQSKAYRYTAGEWQRDESYDYVFNVVQKRYDKVWKSTKNMHRLHPQYDGKAGARSQAMYFELNYTLKGDDLVTTIYSSLGEGKGQSDREFRDQNLTIKLKDISSFMPYNHLRITQEYQYEEGLLLETVELFKLKNGEEIPFMKMEERAYFYLKGKVDKAPTTL
ncbi:MAG: hypothetical protein GY810_06095 [Aureispira sp.]|nr:hypothetical protein [Aureispira sp.]